MTSANDVLRNGRAFIRLDLLCLRSVLVKQSLEARQAGRAWFIQKLDRFQNRLPNKITLLEDIRCFVTDVQSGVDNQNTSGRVMGYRIQWVYRSPPKHHSTKSKRQIATRAPRSTNPDYTEVSILCFLGAHHSCLHSIDIEGCL